MKMDIEGIKDAVYELEGLLELADLREDKLPALLPLMRNKLEIINALFETPEEDDEIEETVESDDTDLPETEDEEIEDEVFTEEPQGIEKEVVTETTTVTEEYSADFSSSESADDSSYEEFAEGPEEESEEGPEEESEEEPEEEESEEYDESPVFLAAEEEDDEEETPAPRKQYADPNAPKPAFCINDRFRFRRELFHNSDSDFNAAMDLVATMVDYEEAEDYFIGELGWDFEKAEVMDFMAIIRNYFEK